MQRSGRTRAGAALVGRDPSDTKVSEEPLIPTKLQPRKVHSALRRRWFERAAPRMPLTHVNDLVDVGSAYGGWTVPLNRVDEDWTCYCVGIGGDISFDLALAARGATVRAIEPVAEYVQRAEADAAEEPRVTTHQVAITTEDGPLRMQVTHHAGSHSVSSVGLYDSSNFVEVPGKTLPSLMRELGDERIDLLKLDIEGAEYEVIPTIDLRSLGVRVFATQLHHTGSVGQVRSLVAGLHDQGYVPVACRPVVKIAFMRAHDLVTS